MAASLLPVISLFSSAYLLFSLFLIGRGGKERAEGKGSLMPFSTCPFHTTTTPLLPCCPSSTSILFFLAPTTTLLPGRTPGALHTPPPPAHTPRLPASPLHYTPPACIWAHCMAWLGPLASSVWHSYSMCSYHLFEMDGQTFPLPLFGTFAMPAALGSMAHAAILKQENSWAWRAAHRLMCLALRRWRGDGDGGVVFCRVHAWRWLPLALARTTSVALFGPRSAMPYSSLGDGGEWWWGGVLAGARTLHSALAARRARAAAHARAGGGRGAFITHCSLRAT